MPKEEGEKVINGVLESMTEISIDPIREPDPARLLELRREITEDTSRDFTMRCVE
jgi:hypothetical protein